MCSVAVNNSDRAIRAEHHCLHNSHGQFGLGRQSGPTIAVSLQDAGYRTGLIGKYINGYPSPEGLTYIPPGWSNWFGRIAKSDGDVPYNYRLNQNGIITSYGATEADYATDVYFAKALSIIDGTVTAGVPFFVVVSVMRRTNPVPSRRGTRPCLRRRCQLRPHSMRRTSVTSHCSFAHSSGLAAWS